MLTCSIVLLYVCCKVNLRTNNYQSGALFLQKIVKEIAKVVISIQMISWKVRKLSVWESHL